MRGKFSPKEPRVTEKRKSPRAESIPANFPPRPWNQGRCPAFFSSEKWSMSPANSGASTFSGHGRPDLAPDRRCEDFLRKLRALDAAVLNLGAFLHERHAGENFGGLLQLLQ